MASKAETARFEALWERARLAAYAAHTGAEPTPMVVFDANLDGSPRPGGNRYFVADGPCGFAGVTLPANTAFGRWLKKTGRGHRNYGGGLYVSTNFSSQSLARAEDAAMAFQKVLREAGIERVYVRSRLD